MTTKSRWLANAVMVLALALGGSAMLMFVVFLFSGAVHSLNLGFRPGAALGWNAFLSFVFFAQHSGMARRRFRLWLSCMVPTHFHAALFAVASGVALWSLILLWQPSPVILYELQGILRWATRGLFLLGLAGLAWGMIALGSFDPFGRGDIRAHLRGEPPRQHAFILRGPYLWVRHPLYFFMLVLIWSGPDLTVDRFVFNSLWTAWIVVGALLEEADLLAEYGEQYRHHQRAVPMLVPWRRPML